MILHLFLAFYACLALVCFRFGWRGANSDDRSRIRVRGGFHLCVVVFSGRDKHALTCLLPTEAAPGRR